METLREQLREYVHSHKKIVIFANNMDKLYLENILLDESENQAFFHIQVTDLNTYLLALLDENEVYGYHLLNKEDGYYYARKSLNAKDLLYFGNAKVDSGLVSSLYSCFEKLSDIDFSKTTSSKLEDLKKMYDLFVQIKGQALFASELYKIALPYLKEDIIYVNYSFEPYSLQKDLLFKAMHIKSLKTSETKACLKPYMMQFAFQEVDYVLENIEKGLLKGNRYLDYLVLIPEASYLDHFLNKSHYPIGYEKAFVNQRQLLFLTALIEENSAQLKEFVDEMWISNFKAASNQQRYQMLVEIVSETLIASLLNFTEDLSWDDFKVIMPLCIPAKRVNEVEGFDQIHICLYQNAPLTSHFKKIFMLGLNEDLYPSKISDKGLILNQELSLYYPNGTPLDHQTKAEWDLALHMLSLADEVDLLSHYGSLAGEEVLPSMLFNDLVKQSGHKKALSYQLKPDLILKDEISAKIEANHHQPLPLSLELSEALFKKKQLSPSELETFNQCPFKHYLKYGLKVNPIYGKLETNAKFGTLMHAVLEKSAVLFKHDFMANLEKVETDMNLSHDGDLDNRLRNFIDVLIQHEPIELGNEEEKYLFEAFKVQSLNTLKVLLYHLSQGQFELAYTEKNIYLKHDEIMYGGYVDRCDLYQDYIKVLDYKSSNKSLDLGLAIQGFNVQMLIYLELLSQHLDKKKGAVLYFNTKERKINSKDGMNLDTLTSADYLKEYQMEGYLLEDEKHDVAYAIDMNYRDSKICHIKYVKSQDTFKGNILNAQQFDQLMRLVFKHLKELVDRCFNQGDISISPSGSKESALKMKVSPCAYCDYQDVCLKDPFYHEEREIIYYHKDEIDALLGGEDEDESSIISE